MRFLSDIDNYKFIGFDLDGTIYNEFQYISEVYKAVASFLGNYLKSDHNKIYRDLIDLWLVHGSSYPQIFKSIIRQYLGVGHSKTAGELEKKCVELYRNGSCHSLELEGSVAAVLDFLKVRSKEMYLLTDGNSLLQRRKVQALGLSRWFNNERLFVTGDFDFIEDKSDPQLSIYIPFLNTIKDSKVLFVGDRDVDQKYANINGFDFYRIQRI